MKETLKSQFQNVRFTLFVALAVWLKTYIITRTSFDLKLESFMQEFILFISPLADHYCLWALHYLQKEKRNYIALGINFVLTFILVGNVMFYGFYNDFVTLPVLGQTSNFGSLGSSVKELFNYKIILAFADILVFFILLKRRKTLHRQSV